MFWNFVIFSIQNQTQKGWVPTHQNNGTCMDVSLNLLLVEEAETKEEEETSRLVQVVHVQRTNIHHESWNQSCDEKEKENDRQSTSSRRFRFDSFQSNILQFKKIE